MMMTLCSIDNQNHIKAFLLHSFMGILPKSNHLQDNDDNNDHDRNYGEDDDNDGDVNDDAA